jgi:hypothetical protein
LNNYIKIGKKGKRFFLKEEVIIMRSKIIATFIFLLSLSLTSQAFATATLHIGFGAGTECATGCGGDPNTSGEGLSDTFNIYQNSGGATDIDSPVWFIIGVPDTNDPNYFNAGDIVNVTYYEDYTNQYPGGDSAVLSWSYEGLYGTLDPGEEVYGDVLGLYPPDANLNDSNNFVNWHDTDLAINEIDADFFGIYVFHIDTSLGAHDLLEVTFDNSSTVPLGSYVIAYGHGSDYGTPFTESGLQAPEPSTFLLLGSGLVALGLIRRKFKIKA